MSATFYYGVSTVALLGVGLVLVWRFVETRRSGYLVMAAGFIAWSLLPYATGPFVESQVDRVASGRGLSFPFGLLVRADSTGGDVFVALSALRGLFGIVLVLVGVLLLRANERGSVGSPPNSRLQPTEPAPFGSEHS